MALVVLTACGETGDPLEPERDSPTCEPALTLDLAPGEAATLPVGADVCVTTRYPGRYAVAFFDTAGIALEGSPGKRFNEADAFEVTVDVFGAPVRSGTSARSAPAPASIATPDGPARRSGRQGVSSPDALPTEVDCSVPGYDPWCRTVPWEAGDRFQFLFGELRTAEVVTVIDGMALAFWVDDLAVMLPTLVRFTRIAEEVVAEVVPFLRTNLLDIDLETGPGTNQILVLARPENLSHAISRPIHGGSLGMILLGLRPGPEGEIVHTVDLQTMAHELGHLWQFAHLYRVSPEPNALLHRWAIEGGADLIAKEYLRSRFDLPIEPEREDWVHGHLAEPEDVFWNQLHVTRGEFEKGYFHSEPFLRDLLVRQLRAGIPYPRALRTLVHGAMEGWTGHPARGFPGEGLGSRLEAELGDQSLVEAVLRWTMSNALDDRNPSETLQNRTFDRAWRTQDGSGWPPAATLGAGQNASVGRPAGSTGYVVIESPGGDGHPLRLTHSTPEYGVGTGGPDVSPVRTGVRWMIARID